MSTNLDPLEVLWCLTGTEDGREIHSNMSMKEYRSGEYAGMLSEAGRLAGGNPVRAGQGERMAERCHGGCLPAALVKADLAELEKVLSEPVENLGKIITRPVAERLRNGRRLDGRAKMRRRLVTIDGKEIWLTERSFGAALRLALAARGMPPGWMDCDHLGSMDGFHQVIRRLKKALKVSGVDGDRVVENNGAKQYRFSVPPGNVTLDNAVIRRHVTGAKILFGTVSSGN